MKLYRMSAGAFVEEGGRFFAVTCESWDELIARPGTARTRPGQRWRVKL